MSQKLPTKEGALRLAYALDLKTGTFDQRGNIGIGATEYFVYLFDKQKKPPLVKWEGVSIQWYIGGGTPEMQNEIGKKLAAAYINSSYPERNCDYCGLPYRGPAVYCSFTCAISDA